MLCACNPKSGETEAVAKGSQGRQLNQGSQGPWEKFCSENKEQHPQFTPDQHTNVHRHEYALTCLHPHTHKIILIPIFIVPEKSGDSEIMLNMYVWLKR